MPTVFSPLVAQSGGAASAAGNVHDVSLLDIFNTARVFNVRAYGAVGDGTTDDQPAFKLCYQALAAAGSGTFYVPRGTYRMARQAASTNGISFDGISNVMVYFEPGAVLLMDNLNGSSLGDFGHGVYVSGRADNIALYNVHVKWNTVAASRSLGDAFRFEGYPDDSNDRIRYVELVNCWAENCPQTGGVLMGCSDVRIVNFRAEDTLGDGLHINACRRVNINGVTGENTGDDTLAFVTYYHAVTVAQEAGGPYNQPSLGQWSNAYSTATNIVTHGGSANGVRIFGSLDVALSNVVAQGKTAAVVVDSAIADGVDVLWDAQASRGITISNVAADTCAEGVHVVTENATFTDNERYWRFDLSITGVEARACSIDGIFVTDCAGVVVRGVKSDSRCRFIGLREGVVDSVAVRGADLYVAGATAAFATVGANPIMNLQLDNLSATGTGAGGTVFLQYLRGVQAGSIKSVDAQANGVYLEEVAEALISNIDVRYPDRGNAASIRAITFVKTQGVTVGLAAIENDGTDITSLEFGGGISATENTRDTRVLQCIYRNTRNQTDNDVVVQGGGNAPVNSGYNMLFYNGGEASPIWRSVATLSQQAIQSSHLLLASTNDLPTNGTDGVELLYNTGAVSGFVQAINRATATYLPLIVGGSTIAFQAGGVTNITVNGTGVAVNGQTPAARPDYTITNPSTLRSIDVSTITLADLARVVATMIQDQINIGWYQ